MTDTTSQDAYLSIMPHHYDRDVSARPVVWPALR
jgi:hypothetical protein